jgi:poly(A) polymerase
MSCSNLDAAVSICRALQAAGHIAVLAGGCVRDQLLGRKPKDYDVATSATPDQVERLFPKTLALGKSFGVIVVVNDNGKIQTEVATLRNDGQYSDGRRPDAVHFVTSLQEDAARRDFTMNAMFQDPVSGEIHDFFGGEQDLKAGIIRAVGDANKRIGEDKLRMMRALRFASRYGFIIDDAMIQAIKRHAKKISSVSAERIRNELEGILVSPYPLTGLDLMMSTRLMKIILPEIVVLNTKLGDQDRIWHPEGRTWIHTRFVLMALKSCYPDASFELLLATLLHDVGKPATQKRWPRNRISNHEHDKVGAQMADVICRRLKLSNEQTRHVCELVHQHMRMHEVRQMRPGKLAVLLEHPYIQDLIALQHADAMGCGSGASTFREFLNGKLRDMEEEKVASKRAGATALVDGDMLITMGFTPGPLFREIKGTSMEAQREGAFTDSAGASDWVREHFGDKLSV